MKKSSHHLNSACLYNASTVLDYSTDFSQGSVGHLQSELQTAHSKIKKLKLKQDELKAALFDAVQKRDQFYKALMNYQAPEALTVLQSELDKRNQVIERMQAKAEVDQLVLREALKSLVNKATANTKVQTVLLQFVSPEFEREIEGSSVNKAVVKALRFAEGLVALLAESEEPLSDQLARVTLLSEEMKASIERSKELLSSKKRETKARGIEKEETKFIEESVRIVKSNTRISICKPKGCVQAKEFKGDEYNFIAK